MITSNAVRVSSELTKTTATTPTIDINVLRERSKHLDLPLISALCNDRTLLKQTVLAAPNSPVKSAAQPIISNKSRYTVTGLTAPPTDINKLKAKSVMSHRHPNDKLPPLPMHTAATGNNYVIDPAMKHKSFSSQPNLKQA